MVYGMRRSEILGLKWKDIDFERKTVSVNNARIQFQLNGKTEVIDRMETKTRSSSRTYPLLPSVEALLHKIQPNRKMIVFISGNPITKTLKIMYALTMTERLLNLTVSLMASVISVKKPE